MDLGRSRNMRASVPEWAAREAAQRVQNDLGVLPRPSAILLAAVGRMIGLSGDALREFATPRPGRKTQRITSVDDFLAALENTGYPAGTDQQ